MLVLTRKVGEKIIIGDNVTVEILEIQGSRIRVGIQAPQGITILRQELLVAKAATAAPSDKGMAPVS